MTPDNVLKICFTCKAGKPRTDYQKHKKAKDGLQSSCRRCRNDRRSELHQIELREGARACKEEYQPKDPPVPRLWKRERFW